MPREWTSLVVWVAVLIFAATYLAGVALVSQWAARQVDQGIQPFKEERSRNRADEEPVRGPLFLDDDSLMWLIHAEKGLQDRSFRVRSTVVDNVPFGREVHWSSGMIWFL